MQGDSFCSSVFEKLGIETVFNEEGAVISEKNIILEKEVDIIECDFKDAPDLVLPVAVSCLLSEQKFRFTGVRNLRLKESDRLSSLEKESRKLGYILIIGEDSIEWKGEKETAVEDPEIETYSDHRVAMSFAMVALKTGKIRIKNPNVVDKSFGLFWEQLGNLPLEYAREGNVMIVKRKSLD